MALGKNKKLGKKGHGKKIIDPLSRKEWYDFKAPVPFNQRSFGKTLVTKSSGTRIATDYVKGRVVEQSLAELSEKNDSAQWRKIRLIVDEIDGHTAKTSFYGMDVTRDKLFQMIRKWHTLIETFVDAKTADGYVFRIFVIGFTKRHAKQIKKKAYAKSSQIREIRKKITDHLQAELAKLSINDVVRNFTADKFNEKITEITRSVYPLNNVTIRKVKVLKRPKIDAIKMNEMYQHDKRPTQIGGKEGEDEAAENVLSKEKRQRGARGDRPPRREGGERPPRRAPAGGEKKQ
jgi:small subunit ribosomal protein S3Ae